MLDRDHGKTIFHAESSDTAAAQLTDSAASNRRFDRQGRVLMPFWTTSHARKQLKYIAVDEDRTQQDLLAEALNMLFAHRGRPTIG
jgi:hypothetical protein